jgi:serine/threonine protein phosphatase PrpC
MTYGFYTDVGRVRENNEDFILVDHLSGVFIVADGMGGYKGGEMASREAALYLLTYVKRAVLGLTTLKSKRQALSEGLEQVNRHIYQLANKNEELKGMGTTAVVAVVESGHILIGHVGDSRAYSISSDGVKQLTKDHSLVQELLDHGSITEQEAMDHPRKHVITQALGSEFAITPEILHIKAKKDFILMLCTDGLSSLLEDHDMQQIVLSTDSLQEAAETLVMTANKKGGFDNCSVILVNCCTE